MLNTPHGGDGLWYKADSYTVENGALIPVGDVHKYDPWKIFDDWRKEIPGVEPPYMKLLNCLNELINNPGKFKDVYIDLISRVPRALDNFERSDMAVTVVDCCSETGLLGVLPRKLHAFRNTNLDDATYSWSDGWAARKDDEVLNLRQVNEGVWASGEFVNAWDDYFDEAAIEVVGYAPPLSPQFWQAYREPVVDFVSESVNLLQIVHKIFDIFAEEDEVLEATETLNAFLRSAKPLVTVNGRKELTCRWVTPSLLDAYAIMIALDALVEPRKVGVCGNCRTLFIPADKRANFCSSKCQNTGNKKLARKRQNRAKKLAASGLSAEDIASQVGSNVDAVKRWIGQS